MSLHLKVEIVQLYGRSKTFTCLVADRVQILYVQFAEVTMNSARSVCGKVNQTSNAYLSLVECVALYAVISSAVSAGGRQQYRGKL